METKAEGKLQINGKIVGDLTALMIACNACGMAAGEMLLGVDDNCMIEDDGELTNAFASLLEAADHVEQEGGLEYPHVEVSDAETAAAALVGISTAVMRASTVICSGPEIDGAGVIDRAVAAFEAFIEAEIARGVDPRVAEALRALVPRRYTVTPVTPPPVLTIVPPPPEAA